VRPFFLGLPFIGPLFTKEAYNGKKSNVSISIVSLDLFYSYRFKKMDEKIFPVRNDLSTAFPLATIFAIIQIAELDS